MRKVEGVFLGVLFVAVLVLYSGGGQPPAALDAGVFTFGNLVVLSFVLLVFHLIFDGDVWMMFPAYVSPLLLLLAFFFPGEKSALAHHSYQLTPKKRCGCNC